MYTDNLFLVDEHRNGAQTKYYYWTEKKEKNLQWTNFESENSSKSFWSDKNVLVYL